MKKFTVATALFIAAVFFWHRNAPAQNNRGGEWATASGSPQRDNWQRNDTRITKDNAKNLKLLWKLKLDNEAVQMHALMEPIVSSPSFTDSHGLDGTVIVAGSSDNIYAVSADFGNLVWKKHFDYVADKPQVKGTGWICPGGLTAAPVLQPPAAFGRGGRGAAPAAGAPAGNAAAPNAQAGNAPAPIAQTNARRIGADRSTGFISTRGVYVISSDGRLHELNLATGEEMGDAVKMLPPNGKPYGLNMVDNAVYTITGNNCGGVSNGAYAIDLKSPEFDVRSFLSNAGGLWGLAGPAVGTDGTIYAETGDGVWDPGVEKYSQSVVALKPKTLELKDYYTPTNQEWLTKRDLDFNATPIVFPYKGRDLLVAAGKEGRLILLDSQSLGGADHRTPLYRTDLVANTTADFSGPGIWAGMASWQDKDGTRWVLAPVSGALNPQMKFPVTHGDAPHGSIVAFKVEEKDGKTVMTPQWVSRDMMVPLPPVIANGVVFALGTGEYVRQINDSEGGQFKPELKIARSTHATLYALDTATGAELYSSGEQIPSFVHFGGLAVAGGQIYFGTYDNMLYAFGIPIEH